VCDAYRSVSAHSKWFKAVCFDTDPRVIGSVDSAGVGGVLFVSADSKIVKTCKSEKAQGKGGVPADDAGREDERFPVGGELSVHKKE
jgi:hypothetical protein